jgi:hypothetical protein
MVAAILNRQNLQYGLRQTRRFRATASMGPQVMMVAGSRNQIKTRCLNEIAGFPFVPDGSQIRSG